MKLIKEMVPYLVILVVVILIRSFIVTPIKVNGQSMYDTLEGDEIMILWKLGDINRYDIVVANATVGNTKDTLIKRVYGLPGETISCENGVLYINNQKIDDSYGYGPTEDFEAITLKEEEYFLLGDNRGISLDSRVLGPIQRQNIEGTTHFILWPIREFGSV